MPSELLNDRKWSGGGLIAVPRCPMCGNAERQLLGSREDAMRTTADDWTFWKCAACQSVWLDPQPDEASISKAYDFDYVTHRAATAVARAGWIDSLVNGYLNWRFGMRREPASRLGPFLLSAVPPLRLKLDYFGRHLPRASGGRRLLDIGCGNGEFIALARSMGWEAEGLDPDPSAIAICRHRQLPVTYGFIRDLTAAKPSARWDVVTMSHSLEHVPDPHAVLRDACEMLSPGGLLWLALPNPAALGARFYGLNWESYDPPRHLCLPDIDVLKSACLEAGFEKVWLPRRGAHTGRLYRRSAEIARAGGRRGLRASSLFSRVLSLTVDLLASLMPRSADETVIVARKARTQSDRSLR
ncbi:MAG: class I SAM-dependent methyltransferase [Luteibacter jiangsuensis]